MQVKDPSGDPTIEVEVVIARPDSLWRADVKLAAGACVADALKASGVAEYLQDQPISAFAVGVFGRLRATDSILADGDRVEIYRPLTADPKDARRQRARRRRG